MSEVGNNNENMDETSPAAAAEQTNTEKPVDVKPPQKVDTKLETCKATNEVEDNKTHDEVFEKTESTNAETDATPVVEVANENIRTWEKEEEILEDSKKLSVLEEFETEPINSATIPQISAVEHVDVAESNENKNITEPIENVQDINSPKETLKGLCEETLETAVDNPKNESEISDLVSDIVEMSSAENVTETIKNVETSIESAQVVAPESLNICSEEPEKSSEGNEKMSTANKVINELSAEAISEESMVMTSDKLNNESITSDKSAEISSESTKKDLYNEPAVSQIASTKSNKESPSLITESDTKDDVPNTEPKISQMESTDSNEETCKEIEYNPEIEANSKNDGILVIEEQKESESLEPMDTYDSQESINLVIDETSSTTDNKDDAMDATKINDDTNMEVDDEQVLTGISENLTLADNLKKQLTKEVAQEEEMQADKEEKLQTSENPETSTQNSSVKKSKNDNDIDKEQSSERVTIESLETSVTPIAKETTDTPNEYSNNLLNKSKDDDVITIEQPPVPIIEIDDDDDIEDATPTMTNDASKDLATKETETEMESNKKLTKPDELKDSFESTDIVMADKLSDSQESSQKEPSKVDKDSLLTIAYEKTLEDSLKPDESQKSAEAIEDTTDQVFYSKECINYECQHKHKQYFKVPQFAFSYFKVAKKKFKVQYICSDCYDKALEMYEEFCGLIRAKQPLLMENIPTGRQEFVEIIDSSDDEDEANKIKPSESTKSPFSKNDLNLIEMELHNTIKTVLERVEIQNQLTWSKTILTERLKRLEVETEYVDSELKSLQKKADKMHEGLYSCPKIKIRQLQPLDLNSGKVMAFDANAQKEVQTIPPVGEIERPGIKLNNMYYAVKNNAIASWVPCKVIEQVEGGLTAQKNVKHYRIKFVKTQVQMPKTVPAKYLAFYDPPSVRLPIGTRVIAYFDATSLARGREKINVQSAFYPGIIAEPLKPNNKFRYLIFYDDGYTQYVYHKDVRLVCHVSDCVWEDVHPASRDFIQKYLTQYSINRPMVQTQKGQSMNTESNGYWLHARVVDIDCSLVLMQFEGSKSHTEWIYRGSLRLGPVFKEYQKTLQKSTPMPISRLPRRTEPFIRYTEDEESSSQQQTEKTNESTRAVARKTFGRPDSMMNSAQPPSQQQQTQTNIPFVKHLNNSTIYVEDENKPKGKVVYYTAKRNLPPRIFKQHKCSPSCLFEITHNLSAYSPLSKPLLSGWERFIIRQKIKKVVTYRAPCGKIMRHMRELHHYLRVTQNVLNVDNFDFSHETNCLAEYVIESAIVQKRDISNGQEKMAIPLVNYYDNTLPPECKYSAKVIPTEGVHINTDPAFCVGCDCDDDCADKTKCACWQLTLTGAKYGNPNAAPEEVGYQYRRLLDHVPTGIYECNSNCKCKSSCLNRVVQNSLTMKLQVFKTSNRGWGLRCINDIPRGSFVCVYAGHLLTEAKANEGGQDAGDEYFAELDYIEVAEQIKEGYESEVELPEPEDEEPYNPEGEDDEFTPSRSFLTRSKQKLNAAKSTRNPEEDSQERQVINFNPNADMNEDSVRENSIRKLYGNDEACYVMDAKISGNLGRYFNHSCAPNMFVQNVFVDTHDLRFPHVAFFSSCNIRAGTELTWNYNYEVGVVPGKVLYCQCGAATCRLRLL